MKFGSSDDYAIRPSFHHMQVLVGVGLFAGSVSAITFGVGLRTGSHDIIVLEKLQIGQKVLMITGAVF